MLATIDDQPFPKEVPVKHRRLGQSDDCQRIRFLVAHEHLGLHTIIVQRLQQTVSSHCSTTRPLARVDNQHSHRSSRLILFRLFLGFLL